MIGYLRGKVLSLRPESVILDVNGVGYEVVCSGAAFSKLSGVRTGEEGEVYTYLQVSEQGVALFGFADLREKELFLPIAENLEPSRWNPAFMDFNPKGLTKADGIGAVIRHLGITREETMAFGDGGNDIDMLRYAGIGVAMGNAEDHVKQAADHVTATVDEDGIGKALRHFGILQ